MDSALGLLIGGWIFVLVWVPIIIISQRKIHPKALFALFFTELWERFSFYGMRALLVLYMTKVLFEQMEQGQADARAYGIYGAFNALLYAAPVIGGLLADRLLGFRKAIIIGGLFMALGQFTLAGTVGDQTLFFIGLALITVGNGLFKPNISSFLGTFYSQDDPKKDGAFTIFYMGINIGAFLAPLTCGYLGEKYDWSYGFLAAGIGILVGLVQFYYNMKDYEDKGNPPDPEYLNKPVFLGLNRQWLTVLGCIVVIPLFALLINAEEVMNLILFIAGIGIIGYLVVDSVRNEDKVEGQRLLVVIVLFFFHMIFWALFEQAGGSLTLFTDRHVNRMGFETSQFQAVNPLYIMLLAPVFSWIWMKLRKVGKEPRTPMKFVWGLAQMALGYGVIVIGAKFFAGNAVLPIIFLLLMYLFHTTGELSLSPVGLSLVTKLSPGKIVGFVMGTWFLSIAFAHKIAGELGKLTAVPEDVTHPQTSLAAFTDVYLIWGVYVVLAATVALLALVPILKKWMHEIH